MIVFGDEVVTRTGFRKTSFADGKIWLNDRVIMVHGYAQRTSNEWPAVGISVPAWMSDYSNRLNAAQVVDNVKRYARNGSIITSHDQPKSWHNLQEALPQALDWLIAQGYEFRLL